MKQTVNEAALKAKELAVTHAADLATVIKAGEPDNAPELVYIVGAYMGTLDVELKKHAEVDNDE